MLKKRIIPCLDIKNGRVVKGINFADLIDAGDPAEHAKLYNDNGADEICFLDITATNQNRNIILETLSSLSWILKSNGYIFIRDFSPLKNFAHKNHHWPKKNIYNFKVSNGHKKFFINSGKYKVIYNKEYFSKKFQTVKISHKQSHKWSDTIIKKTLNYQHKIIKI